MAEEILAFVVSRKYVFKSEWRCSKWIQVGQKKKNELTSDDVNELWDISICDL